MPGVLWPGIPRPRRAWPPVRSSPFTATRSCRCSSRASGRASPSCANTQRATKTTAAPRSLFGFSNSFKSLYGKLLGLKDQRLMARKLTFEKKLRKAVENDSHLGAEAAKVWDGVALGLPPKLIPSMNAFRDSRPRSLWLRPHRRTAR